MNQYTDETSFKPVTHVIFDMDGLLLDSEECYYKIDEAIIGKYGKKVPHDLKFHLLGYSDQDCAQKIIQLCNLPVTPKKYGEEINKHIHLLREVKLLTGAERLIRHLASHKIPMAIGTSSSSHSVQHKLHNHRELFSLFNHMVMGSTDPDVSSGKPAPDIFLVCAERFPTKPQPEECLVFEDAPSGVIAANKAGMQVVMVPDKDLDHESRKNATLVIESLLDFKPEKFGLPAF